MNALSRRGSRVLGSARSAYSLVELLVVLAIIAVLLSLGAYALTGVQQATDEMLAEVNATKNPKGIIKPHPKTNTAIPNQFIVVFDGSVDDMQAEANKIAQKIPMEIIHVYDSVGFQGFAARTPVTNIVAVANWPAVKYIEQDAYVSIGDQTLPTGMRRIGEGWSTPTGGLPHVGVPAVQNLFKKPLSQAGKVGIDVVVAVIDTGVDPTHPDLNVEFTKGFGFPDGIDGNGHGTHVAGTIGAMDNNYGVVGVAPGARLWALKALDASGAGTNATILAAIDFVNQHSSEIRVTNMSLGGKVNQAVNDAVDACVQRGVVMVVAAGNAGKDASGYSPASAPMAICVAALSDSDGKPGGLGPKCSDGDPDDTFASYSNFGTVVSFIAPGTDILSTWPVSMGSYNKISGTSMACPHVAGLAALIRSPNAPTYPVIPQDPRPTGPQNLRPTFHSPFFTPDQVKQIISELVIEGIPGPGRLYPMINARAF